MVNRHSSFFLMRTSFLWTLPRTSLQLGPRTALMGILNVTPDSFSDGGLYFNTDKAVEHGIRLEQDGADLLDIGGESTRPGSRPVGEEEESSRILPVIERLAVAVRIPLSVDTYRATVARRALEAGAQIVNDISGFRFDPALPEVVRNTRAGVVLMHSRGSREEIHKQPATDDPVETVRQGLAASLASAREAGIFDSAIVLDPGIGFSKDAAASLKVLRNLCAFSTLHLPLMAGTSRKSSIRAVVGDAPEAKRMGTAATVALAIAAGVHIVRVHDVLEMRAVADMTDRILRE